MPSRDTAPARAPGGALLHAGLLLILAYAGFLAVAFSSGAWLVDGNGNGVATDFVNVFAAGRLALAGRAVEAYDWTLHRMAEVAALGTDFPGYYGWHYPPPFLAIAALLALMPYAPALLAWAALSLIAYLAALRAVLPGVGTLVAAVAFPASLWNVAVGQNGFFTAALLGGALALLTSRPLLAGVLIGLLTYKPQFGVALPFVLAAAGAWTVFGAAAATALVMAALSFVAFGPESWHAFVVSLGQTTQAVMHDGRADVAKLHSVFGLARTFGASAALAWSLHGVVAAAAIAATALLWRTAVAYPLKAAALALAGLVASPYVYVYDLVVLAVPIAFLLRQARSTGLRPDELAALLLAAGLILAFPALNFPSGIAAIALIAAVLARRVATSLGAGEGVEARLARSG
jgi:arabinofuranan 3-O-arabinosyltransferase